MNDEKNFYSSRQVKIFLSVKFNNEIFEHSLKNHKFKIFRKLMSVFSLILIVLMKYPSVPHRSPQFNTSVPPKDHTFSAPKTPRFNTKKELRSFWCGTEGIFGVEVRYFGGWKRMALLCGTEGDSFFCYFPRTFLLSTMRWVNEIFVRLGECRLRHS